MAKKKDIVIFGIGCTIGALILLYLFQTPELIEQWFGNNVFVGYIFTILMFVLILLFLGMILLKTEKRDEWQGEICNHQASDKQLEHEMVEKDSVSNVIIAQHVDIVHGNKTDSTNIVTVNADKIVGREELIDSVKTGEKITKESREEK